MYKFNLVNPPLLKDDLDIHSIPAESLKKDIGIASWTESTDVRTSDDVLAWVKTDTIFHVSRFQHWVPDDVPAHYAEETKFRIDTSKGYKKGQKEAIERTLSLDVGGSVPLGGMKADIKAEIRINEETTEEWTESTQKEIEFSFKADTTYIGWRLFDTVLAHRTITRVWSCCDPRRPMGPPAVEESVSSMDVLMKYYQDKLKDSDIKAFSTIIGGLARKLDVQIGPSPRSIVLYKNGLLALPGVLTL